MQGKLVIIRTLDIGADEKASYFELPTEENPALGLRAIRICFFYMDHKIIILMKQLRQKRLIYEYLLENAILVRK
jgi:phosphoenolpyruvate-protein kinase (PTS system EI component)